jgi:hypothetical protein
MKSTAYFSGALSQANTAIAQAKNAGVTDIAILEEKAASVIFTQLVNMTAVHLFSSYVHCDLENSKTDVEIPIDMKTNIIIQSCALVIKDALSLHNIEPSSSTYNSSRIVWHSGDFKADIKQKFKRDDNGKKFQSEQELAELDDELNAMTDAERNDCGDSCKV